MRVEMLIIGIAAFGTLALSPVPALAQWSDLGLSGREVWRLQLCHGMLYACTNDGLYRKASDTVDSSWVLLGFGGQRVYDLLAVSPETLIVAREVTGTGADTVSLLRSTDGGTNWNPFQNGLGADGSTSRRVLALLEPPGAPGTVLAGTRQGMNKSTDGGLTWVKVSSGGRFYFLAAGISTLWGGGEGSAFLPFARRSTNGGANWTTVFNGESDGRAIGMVFDPTDPDVAFLALDSEFPQRTADNGNTWVPVPLPPGVRAILASRAFPPLRLYAQGDAPPGGATIFRSDDGAASWSPVSFPAAGSSIELTILVRSGPAADTLFLGMASGVLRYVDVELVGVDRPVWHSKIELLVHPNPSPAATVFTFVLPRPTHVSLQVLDPTGREVATLLSADHDAGPHRFTWIHPGLPSGVYFCQLRAGDAVASRKVLTVR